MMNKINKRNLENKKPSNTLKKCFGLFLKHIVAPSLSKKHEAIPKTEYWPDGSAKLNWHGDRKDW